MHSIVTTFRGAVIKVEVANFGAAIDTLIDQDAEVPVPARIQNRNGVPQPVGIMPTSLIQ